MYRSLAYNEANTMSSQYAGLQSKVTNLSLLALYTHCFAHNLNLILIDSISSSINAVSFLAH